MTLAQYEFSSPVNRVVIYDMDYVLVSQGNSLGFIVTKGLSKFINGEKYHDNDIYSKIGTQGTIGILKGYSTGEIGSSNYKRMAWTIERQSGNFYVRNYELIPGSDPSKEGKIIQGSTSFYIGSVAPSSMDFNEKYMTIGFRSIGYGQITIYDLKKQTSVYSINGNSQNRAIGEKVLMNFDTLEPKGIPTHYVYYNSMRYESERVTYFYSGLITLMELEKTIYKNTTKVVPDTDINGNYKIDNKTGEMITKKVVITTSETVPDLQIFNNFENYN